MVRKRIKSIIFSSLVFIGVASRVYGQDCNSLIVDEAGVFRDRFYSVDDAAQKLVDMGAQVRIRTINTFGNAGSLDQYERQIERRCPSWQDGNGARKNNLLVMIIAVRDRKTGLYYGSQWTSALDRGWLRVQNDYMNSRFKIGDFAGGFAAGINEISKLINISLNPPQSTRSESAPPPVVVAQVPNKPSEPVDLSGLWKVMMLLVGLGALSALGFFLWQLKLKSERRRACQQKAELRRQAAASRVNEFQPSVDVVEEKIKSMRNLVSEDDLKALTLCLIETNNLGSIAIIRYGDVDKSAGDPSRSGLSEAEYQAMEEAYDGVIKAFDEADNSLRGVQALLKNLATGIAEAPQRLANINARVVSLRQVVAGGKEVFQRLEDNFIASSWQSVKGNGTEALGQIEQAVSSLNEADRNIQNHEWGKTEVSFKKANDSLDRAESLINSIVAIEKSLQMARDDAPREIQAAKADINNARDYIRKYDEDIKDSLESDLQKAEAILAHATNDMKDGKPDYFEVSKNIKKAHELADKILAEARSEHEAAERLRQKAVSALKSAKSRVSKAEEYIGDHSGDVDSDAEAKLKKAKKALREAESASDINTIIILAGQADGYGKDAYRLAENDVSSAYVPTPTYSSSSYSSSISSDSGGGSTDWGSSSSSGGDSGGGGSSSW